MKQNERQEINLLFSIHYFGRNKPWNDTYVGILDVFYRETMESLQPDECKNVRRKLRSRRKTG